MEVKKNLNTIQRKMLDEIYSEQFKKRESLILLERSTGRKKLEAKLLKDLVKTPEVKKMLEAGKTFYELSVKLMAELRDINVSVTNKPSSLPELTIGGYYGGQVGEFPEVEEYEKETRRISMTLSEKKKEMRAKIYGVAASYEDVDAEIKELLKGV